MTPQNPTSFTSFRIDGVPPFHVEGIEFDFDPRVNVFIGPNATGKSTILREMAFREAQNRFPETFGKSRVNSIPELTEVPHIYVPPIRASLKGPDARRYDVMYGSVDWEGGLPAGPAFTYEFSSRSLDQIKFPERTLDFVDGSFQRLHYWWTTEDAKEWLRWQYLLGQDPWDDFDPELVYWAMEKLYTDGIRDGGARTYEVRDKAYACCRSICKEVFLGVNPRDRIIEGQYGSYDLENPNQVPRLEFGTSFETPDTDRANPIHLRDLSTGTQGLYVWIWYLACRIAYYYEPGTAWEKLPAILLIDEIENHLHPTWQRRVIPALLEHFPGLQIFATTHSPFVVAGLKAGQVHVLSRDANGVVKASTEQRDVVGWTADEVLRNLMGVRDPTDSATAAAANELRELRSAGPYANEKEEEDRQRRIADLRGQVDRDLLAGGPMAAQREVFERQFAEALEKYRRSQSLQQEND